MTLEKQEEVSIEIFIKAKIAHMTYPCVPMWMKPREKDPFDYPLRDKKEMMLEQFIVPPLFTGKIISSVYSEKEALWDMPVHKADMRDKIVKIECHIDKLGLTPLQKKRLIFLLGSRYKPNNPRFKIVVRQYNDFDHNLHRALDILKQLYWEAKRAPLFIWERMGNKQRRRLKEKMYGKDKLKREEIMKQTAEQEKIFREKFEGLISTGNYNRETLAKHYQEFLTKYGAEVIKPKDEKTDLLKEHEEKKVQEYANLESTKKRYLSKKAYDMFYKKQGLANNPSSTSTPSSSQ